MKSLLTLMFIVLSVSIFGQTADEIHLVKKQKKYYLTKTCYDILSWEEIRLADKKVEEKINSILKGIVESYKLDSAETDLVADRCKGRMEYDVECKSVYSKNGLISYTFSAYIYFEGAAHGHREWETKNIDAKTGDVLNFWEIVDNQQRERIEAFLYQRLKIRLQTTDDFLLERWKSQTNDLNFEISDKGITINYIGDNYATSVIDIFVSYEELRPFINIQGHLKPFYNE